MFIFQIIIIISYSFAELLETEKRYVRDLQFVIENYLQELSKIDCPKQVREKREFIFSNIEDIFAFHKVYVIYYFLILLLLMVLLNIFSKNQKIDCLSHN